MPNLLNEHLKSFVSFVKTAHTKENIIVAEKLNLQITAKMLKESIDVLDPETRNLLKEAGNSFVRNNLRPTRKPEVDEDSNSLGGDIKSGALKGAAMGAVRGIAGGPTGMAAGAAVGAATGAAGGAVGHFMNNEECDVCDNEEEDEDGDGNADEENPMVSAYGVFKNTDSARAFERATPMERREMLQNVLEARFGESKTKVMIQKLVNMGLFENGRSRNLALAAMAISIMEAKENSTPTEEDHAYKAGYEGKPYNTKKWGERMKAAYNEGKKHAASGFPPNCRLEVNDSNKGSGTMHRQFN